MPDSSTMTTVASATSTTGTYCVKCKTKVIVVAPESVTFSNGKQALQGNCPHCGTKTFKIVSSR